MPPLPSHSTLERQERVAFKSTEHLARPPLPKKLGRPKNSVAVKDTIPNSSKNILATGLQRIPMKGSLPYFNDHGCVAVDDQGGKIYMFGGKRPGTDDLCCDFNVCDVRTMNWQDWTNSLSREFAPSGPLPPLQNASATFLNIHGWRYVFLFGGYDGTEINSQLVAINVSTKVWSIVPVEGIVAPRMDAAMVGIENRLYIFGGRQSFEYGSPNFRSFSVAECIDSRWKWIYKDMPYPPHISDLGFGGRALAVYGGKQILLTPGRKLSDDCIDMNSGNMVLFHCKHGTFQSASQTEGVFPVGLHWYFAYTIEASQPVLNPAPPSRGRKPIEFVPGPPPADPYAIICGWISSPYSSNNHLVPELYRYQLPPVQEVECLDVKQKLWELELDLQSFIAVGRRLYIFGHDNDETDADTRYTVCIELDTQQMKNG
ncbi:uncharacterized protein EV420DRAFT_1533721 [Desarmillaria tabescens]|uniref:Galactose oxidase n=1 Tax=Armillaria tabescens TaxID=1929756 RepID=A0AA39N7Z6_ARMTA|nr:uncharacterized protein EV420DRAFT_1533721 [Desarmillaria tabescens]KAK0460699.1 hypothetical protein EV420DRAFT_1533721 [Desarmillaria tabescens]